MSPKIGRKEIIGMVLALIAFTIPFLVSIEGLSASGHRMLAIFLVAVILWVSEAIPLVATAVMVIGLEVLLVSDKALLAVPEDAPTATSLMGTLASPVIILFLGGFLLAEGAAKYYLDKNLAAVLIKPFSGSVRTTMLGLMVITALLSMFMSNTATTATMFAVVIPVLAALPNDKAKAGVALSIPVAANVGGIGTPVGTPPNAIALGSLAKMGQSIDFLTWMILAVPFVIVLIAIAWFCLCLMFVPRGVPINLEMEANFPRHRMAVTFYIIAGITVVAWMSESLHGLSASIVAFLAVVAMLVSGTMTGSDLGKISWPVLWLVAGGIALGQGVGSTGLDKWMMGLIQWDTLSPIWVTIILAALGVGMSNVISHSAGANLLIPLGLTVAVSLQGGDTTSTALAAMAMTLALSCSLGMCLPISTPPNAIAYATGTVSTAAMVRIGAIVGGVGMILLLTLFPLLWNLVY